MYVNRHSKYQIQKEIKTPTSSEQACTKVVFVLKLISAISELDIGSAFSVLVSGPEKAGYTY